MTLPNWAPTQQTKVTRVNYPAVRAMERVYANLTADGICPSYDCDGAYYDYSWCWAHAARVVGRRYRIASAELLDQASMADNLNEQSYCDAAYNRGDNTAQWSS